MILSQVALSKSGRWTAKTAVLLTLGVMCLTGGLRYSVQLSGDWPPNDAPGAFVLIDQFLPLEVWGAWWLVAAVLCFGAALIPQGSKRFLAWCRERPWLHYLESAAPASAFGIHVIWGLTYLTWWVFGLSPYPGGNPDSWRAAGLYLGIASLIWFSMIAGKPRPKRRAIRGRNVN